MDPHCTPVLSPDPKGSSHDSSDLAITYDSNHAQLQCHFFYYWLHVTSRAYRLRWLAAGAQPLLAAVFARTLHSAPSEAQEEGPRTPQGPPGGKEKVQVTPK